MKNWKTTLGGFLLAASLVCQTYGIKVGHVGNGDYTALAGIVGAMLTGGAAKDSSNQGPAQPDPKQ